jgi:hypothetical protein
VIGSSVQGAVDSALARLRLGYAIFWLFLGLNDICLSKSESLNIGD